MDNYPELIKKKWVNICSSFNGSILINSEGEAYLLEETMKNIKKIGEECKNFIFYFYFYFNIFFILFLYLFFYFLFYFIFLLIKIKIIILGKTKFRSGICQKFETPLGDCYAYLMITENKTLVGWSERPKNDKFWVCKIPNNINNFLGRSPKDTFSTVPHPLLFDTKEKDNKGEYIQGKKIFFYFY